MFLRKKTRKKKENQPKLLDVTAVQQEPKVANEPSKSVTQNRNDEDILNKNVKVDEESKDIKPKAGDKDLIGTKQEDTENKLLEEESDKQEKTENPEDTQNETTKDKLAKESENDQKEKTDLNDKPTDEVKKGRKDTKYAK